MNRKEKIEKALNNGTFKKLEFNNEDDILFEIFEKNLELENFKDCALITPELYYYEPPIIKSEEGSYKRNEILESINKGKRAEKNRKKIQQLLNEKIISLINKDNFSSLFRLIDELNKSTFSIDDSIIYATKFLLKNGNMQQIINMFKLLKPEENYILDTTYHTPILYGIEKNKDQFLNAMFSMYLFKQKWDIDNNISVDIDHEMLKLLVKNNRIKLLLKLFKMHLNSENPRFFIWANNFIHKINIEKEIAHKEVEHEREKNKLKTRIFQAMSHTIGSFVWSDKLIINKIREGRSSENDIRRLELFNDLILSIMNSIKIAYSSDEIINCTLDKDIEFSKNPKNISLYHLFYFCFNINLERLIRGDEGWGSTRKSFFFLDKKDKTNYWKSIDYFESIQNSPNFLISSLSEDAITNFIEFFKSNVLQKVNRYFDIQINELKNLYVIRNSYTFSVLFVIFLELTKNMFRYGSIKDKVKRIFKIYTVSDKEYFHINFINFVHKSSFVVKEGTLQGLAMVQEFSKVLGNFKKDEKPFENSNFNKFSIELSIRKKKEKK
jgi:hypothetical protein